MFFSIIIPTYNRATILLETLQAVLRQSFSDYEIIIVDDGSTDETAELIQALKHPKVNYYYKHNEERSIARNFGADKASGKYLIFLDSDDKMKENHLISIYEFIKSHKYIPKFIFSGYTIIKPDGSLLYEYGINGMFKRTKLFYGNYLGCSSVIIDANIFKNFYFSTNKHIILFEDWELWLRIIAQHPLYCFPGKSIVMVNHGGRSVLNYTAAQIDARIIHFKKQVLTTSNEIQTSFFYKSTFFMGIYSYAALHIAMTKKSRHIALKYLMLALFHCPLFVFKRRFLGIIKQLF